MLEIDEEVVVGQDLFYDRNAAPGGLPQSASAVRGGTDIAELLVVSLLPQCSTVNITEVIPVLFICSSRPSWNRQITSSSRIGLPVRTVGLSDTST